MATATILALTAAVLHAGWNLVVKSSGDRFLALWGPFFTVGLLAVPVLAVTGGVTRTGAMWAAAAGLTHVVYAVGLVRAYDAGDFSHTYPLARGGGALAAGIGGLVVLHDSLTHLGVIGLCIIAVGLVSLGRIAAPGAGWASLVALSIGVYSTIDAQAMRSAHSPWYPLATWIATGSSVTIYGLLAGRGGAMLAALRTSWHRFTAVGAVVAGTYALVQIAFRYAPVGYVTGLRECSVVVAVLAAAVVLHEAVPRRRAIGALIVLIGMVVLVVGR